MFITETAAGLSANRLHIRDSNPSREIVGSRVRCENNRVSELLSAGLALEIVGSCGLA